MIVALSQTLARVDADRIEAAIADLRDADRVFIAGAGRSGAVLRCLAIRLTHLGKRVHFVGEPTTPAIGRRDLLVFGSGSGRTGSLVVFAERAKSLGARILLFTIDPQSPIGLLADDVVQIWAPSHKALVQVEGDTSGQPQGSLFEQSLLILLDAIVVALMTSSNMTSEDLFSRHANLE